MGFSREPHFKMSKEGIDCAKRIMRNQLIPEEEARLDRPLPKDTRIKEEIFMDIKNKNFTNIDAPVDFWKEYYEWLEKENK